jgi:hypothetical protein
MTAAAVYEPTPQSQEDVSINPVTTFLFLLITPYILFFALLMLLTGQYDLPLLYTSVIQVSGTAYVKAWIIGSFLLAVIGTVVLSGYRTKTYVIERMAYKRPRNTPFKLQKDSSHFSIEELPSEQASIPSRHVKLERILDDTEPAS